MLKLEKNHRSGTDYLEEDNVNIQSYVIIRMAVARKPPVTNQKPLLFCRPWVLVSRRSATCLECSFNFLSVTEYLFW
jgi:hypothetical protein